jgi:hypothetical protein
MTNDEAQAVMLDIQALDELRQLLADDGDLVTLTPAQLKAIIANTETRAGRRMWARLLLGSQVKPATREARLIAATGSEKQGALL